MRLLRHLQMIRRHLGAIQTLANDAAWVRPGNVMKSALQTYCGRVFRHALFVRTPSRGSNIMKLFASKRRWLVIFATVAVVYVMLAHVMPLLWTHHEHGPGFAFLTMVTRTST